MSLGSPGARRRRSDRRKRRAGDQEFDGRPRGKLHQLCRANPPLRRPARDHWPLQGKTIIPGLIEAHTHASFDADMRAYVKNGVTTIRFAGLDQGTVERLRSRIDAGELIGPRILSCGPMIDQPPPAYPEWSVAVGTPAEAAATAERLILDHDLDALILTQRVTAPVMRAVIEVAHAHGRLGCRADLGGGRQGGGELGIDELHTSSRVYASRLLSEGPTASLHQHRGPSRPRFARLGIDRLGSDTAIMEAMVEHGVSYCGMQVITQFQVGEGAAELETDSRLRHAVRGGGAAGISRFYAAPAGQLDTGGSRITGRPPTNSAWNGCGGFARLEGFCWPGPTCSSAASCCTAS